MSQDQFQELFNNFQNQGLNHIWHGLNDHCSSNVQCGPNACCVQPTLTGKRAITTGTQIHFASYCAPLRDLGQTCSAYHQGHTPSVYNFQCPCKQGFKCKGTSVQIHPLLIIQKDEKCVS